MYFFVYKKDLVKYHSIYLIEVPRKEVMNKVILPIVIILLGSFLLFNDLSINDKKEQINIIQPKEFCTIVVPFDSSEFGYKLTPKNYIEAIEMKMKNYLH